MVVGSMGIAVNLLQEVEVCVGLSDQSADARDCSLHVFQGDLDGIAAIIEKMVLSAGPILKVPGEYGERDPGLEDRRIIRARGVKLQHRRGAIFGRVHATDQ